MSYLRYLAGFLAAFALTGCTTELKAVRAPAQNTPTAGAPYNLSFTQFNIKLSRRLASCYKPYSDEELAAHKQGKPLPTRVPLIRVAVEAVATKAEARDPKRTYVIDLASLQGAFKKSEVKMTYYDSGVIKGINASAEDKTGEFIASTAQTLAKLAVSAGSRGPGRAIITCTDKAAAAVDRLPAAEQKLVELTEQITTTTERVKQYIALADALGKALPQSDRDILSKAVRDLISQQGQLRDTKKNIENDLRFLSVSDEKNWPSDGETFESVTPVVPGVGEDVLDRWVGGPDPSLTLGTAVYLSLSALEPSGRATPCGDACAEDRIPGFKYRMPVLGKLSMCEAGKMDKPDNAGVEVYKCASWKGISKPVMISQLGPVFTLPLKSAPFSNKKISATFAENGNPTELGMSSEAASDKVAATAASLGDTVVALRDSRSAREVADLENKLKVLKLKKELEAESAAPPPPADRSKQDATDAFLVDTALLQAEKANLEARNALEELKRLP